MHAKAPTWREGVLAGLGMLVLAVLFCGPRLLCNWDETPCDHGDTAGSYFPYCARAYYPIAREVAGPWDPTLWTGLPESHSPFGRYYPVSGLLFVLCPLGLAFSLTFVVHHALAGLGTYLLLRTGGFRPASAVAGSLVFGFSSFMVFHRGFVTIFQTAAWLPWVLWALEKYRHERAWIWVLTAGTLLALQALAGHAQTILIGGMTCVLHAAYFTLVGPGPWRPRWRFAGGVALACVLGVIGSLPQTLPMMEVGRWTPYATPDWDFFRSGSFQLRFLVGLAGPWLLGDKFGVPYPAGLMGIPDSGCFFGLLPLALAVIGLRAGLAILKPRSRGLPRSGGGPPLEGGLGDQEPHPRPVHGPSRCSSSAAAPWLKPNSENPRERGSQTSSRLDHPPAPPGLPRCADSPVNGAKNAPPTGLHHTSPFSRSDIGFWLVLFAFHALLMLGRNSPLYLALFQLPVYNMFHVPSRHLWVVSLAVAWFAALGFEQVRSASAGVRWRLWRSVFIAFALLAIVCVVIVVTIRWQDKPALTYPGFWIPLACGALVLALLAMVLRSSRRRPLWLALMLLLAFLELRFTLGDFVFTPMSTARAVGAEHFPEFVRHLRAARHDGVPTRCLMECGCWTSSVPKGQAPAAWGQTWGLSVLNVYSQSMPRSLARLLHLDNYGFTQFNRVLWEERGLSAVGGRFFVPKRAPRPTAPGGFVEAAREDIWPDGQPPRFTSQPGQPSRLATRVVLKSAYPYLLEGELLRNGPLEGEFHIRLVDFGQTVGDFRIGPGDFTADRGSFAFLLSPLVTRFSQSLVEIHLECAGTMAVELSGFSFWCLRERPADTSAAAARALARTLREQQHCPYRLHADGEPPVYENPHARGLANLVREVRAAADDLDAARGILEARDRPVRDLAFVIAPGGRSHDLTLNDRRAFASGTATIESYRADDLTVRTRAAGEGFLVLTVTRCRGWTATVDGEPVPIHAVDGPLMGVRVPPGEHRVRLRFRPVSFHAGATAAGVVFTLAWGAGLTAIWLRRRRRLQTPKTRSGSRPLQGVPADGFSSARAGTPSSRSNCKS